MKMTRSDFMRSATVGAGLTAIGLALSPGMVLAQPKKKRKERGPRIPLETIEEFVRVAHSDFDRVKSLLKEQPKLINATWDWGDGDFETALGAAAHMGRQDIARYLLARNARLDVFAAAMLGKLDVVKAAVAAFPDTPSVPGPHGIPLLVHARKGGDQAAAVTAYLESFG